MSKLDEILDYLDSGYDRDIEWSERIGSRVFIHYRDGTELVVAAAMEPGGSGSGAAGDATQKLGTCPTCRHAEHEGHICLNMASDYDCGCDKRPAKVADDATQKLVDGLREADKLVWYDGAPVENHAAHAAIVAALEAAQRPPVSPEVHWSSTDRPHCVQCGERIWAGQMMTVLPSGLREHQDCDLPYRPPVNPEQRETIRALLSHHLSKVIGWARMKPERDYSPEWQAALYEATDALLALATDGTTPRGTNDEQA